MAGRFPKFEDTRLLQHPEVRKAYDLQESLIKSGHTDEDGAGVSLIMATQISILCANKDPSLVAAALLNIVYLNASEDKAVYKQFQTSLAPLTMQYLVAFKCALDPVAGIVAFPGCPKTEQHGAIVLLAASYLRGLLELDKAPLGKQQKLRQLKAFSSMMPGMLPEFEEYFAMGDLRKTEPALMAEIDKLTTKIKAAAAPKKAKPSVPGRNP